MIFRLVLEFPAIILPLNLCPMYLGTIRMCSHFIFNEIALALSPNKMKLNSPTKQPCRCYS
jgi:hypothetical protein